jgi:rod shape-determining protein MreD
MNNVIIRKVLVYAVYIILISIIQFNLSNYLTVWGVKPNIFIIFTVLVAFMYGFSDGVTIGISCGLIMDLYSGRFLGVGVLICLYLSVVSSFLLKKHFKKSLPLAIFHIIVATILYHGILYSLSLLVSWKENILIEYAIWVVTARLGPSLFINTLLFVILLIIMKFISPYKKNIEILDTEN